MYWLFLLFPFFISAFDAKHLESHLKKASHASDIHKMRNVDFIYTINLDPRPEKFLHCTRELHPYGIYPYRFSAVNGWELSPESLDSLGVSFTGWMPRDLWGTYYLKDDIENHRHEVMQIEGRNYYCHCMSRGAIGIVLSHLSVLQDAWDAGFQTIWVMEDDIEVIQNPHLISDRIEELDALVGSNGWDILFTDRDTKNSQGEYVPCCAYARRPNFTPADPSRFARRETIGEHFTKVGARYGAYSMIVRRSGMEKILNFIKEHGIFLPYDMDFFLPDTISLYAVIGDIVSFQPGSPSDNSTPAYEKLSD